MLRIQKMGGIVSWPIRRETLSHSTGTKPAIRDRKAYRKIEVASQKRKKQAQRLLFPGFTTGIGRFCGSQQMPTAIPGRTATTIHRREAELFEKPFEGSPETSLPQISEHGHLIGLGTFGALDLHEAHPLTFFQGPKSGALDGTEMNEQIRTVIPLDEAISLTFIEPFHGSLLNLTHGSLTHDRQIGTGRAGRPVVRKRWTGQLGNRRTIDMEQEASPKRVPCRIHCRTSQYAVGRSIPERFWLFKPDAIVS